MSFNEDEFEELVNDGDDFYSCLNVSRQATPEEISSAYRNLSRIYHPDKHGDEGSKEEAEMLFNRIKKAYEVLSDPHLRAIYDSLGHKGLETEGWEVVQRTRGPEEIREEYERLKSEREERRMQQKTNPKGTIVVHINATDVFTEYDLDYDEPPLFPAIEVSGMTMSQSIEAPLTSRDTAILSGTLNLSNGVGNGAFMISGRRLINKGWFEVDVGAGNGPILGVKGSRNITQRVFCNGGLTMNVRPGGILPGLVGTLAVQLDKHTVGYLTYNAGMQSSLATAVEYNDERQNWNLTVLLGVPHCFISMRYMRKFPEQETKLRCAAKVGTFGYLVEYGCEKKVSKYSSLVASVMLGVPTGVTLKVKLIRASQSYVFPIHLSEEIIPASVFYATVTPLLAWFVLKKAVIDPMNAEARQRTIDKAKERNKVRLEERKREAEAAVRLMAALFERVVREEEKRDGLIVLRAVYGKHADGASNTRLDEMGFLEDNPDLIDVKVPVQCMVKDGRLVFHETPKSDLNGFYDPCVGEEKHLRVDYRLNGQTYSVTVGDKECLRIPN